MLIYGCKEKLEITNLTIILSSLLQYLQAKDAGDPGVFCCMPERRHIWYNSVTGMGQRGVLWILEIFLKRITE